MYRKHHNFLKYISILSNFLCHACKYAYVLIIYHAQTIESHDLLYKHQSLEKS